MPAYFCFWYFSKLKFVPSSKLLYPNRYRHLHNLERNIFILQLKIRIFMTHFSEISVSFLSYAFLSRPPLCKNVGTFTLQEFVRPYLSFSSANTDIFNYIKIPSFRSVSIILIFLNISQFIYVVSQT